jgi:uncharacterized protein YifE (UPF0438 family)
VKIVPTTATGPSFVFGCSTAVFPAEEIAALTEVGLLLEGLASGTVRPATPDQEHFLKVDRGEADPLTVAERAWVRRKARLDFERGDRVKSPQEKPTDYGMVEFDADRCWW